MKTWKEIKEDGEAHCAEVNQSYFGHMVFASGYGIQLAWLSVRCFVHALIPGLDPHGVTEAMTKMLTHRQYEDNNA